MVTFREPGALSLSCTSPKDFTFLAMSTINRIANANSVERSLPAHVKRAGLEVVNLRGLQDGSEAEIALLLKAATTDGFFYLDLSHESYEALWSSVDIIFDLSATMFNNHDAIKSAFDVDVISSMKTNGYKPQGRNIVSKDGTKDSFESWAVSHLWTCSSFILALVLELRQSLTDMIAAAKRLASLDQGTFSAPPRGGGTHGCA